MVEGGCGSKETRGEAKLVALGVAEGVWLATGLGTGSTGLGGSEKGLETVETAEGLLGVEGFKGEGITIGGGLGFFRMVGFFGVVDFGFSH